MQNPPSDPGLDDNSITPPLLIENGTQVPPRKDGIGRFVVPISIVLLILFVLSRTYQSATSNRDKDSSDVANRYYKALEATKSAYSYSDPDGVATGKAVKRTSSIRVSSRQRLEENAIRDWRSLIAPQRPQFSRKLGITLALFGRKDALQPLLAAATETIPPPKTIAGKLTLVASESNLHPLTRVEESYLWTALYGPTTHIKPETARLEADIQKLKLGWFENIVLDRLYSRAGLTCRAANCRSSALNSAQRMASANSLEIMIFIGGVLLWFVAGVVALARLVSRWEPSFGSVKARIGAGSQVEMLRTDYSYRARTTCFAVYLALYLFIGYPLRLLLPWLRHLPVADRLRFTSLLQIAVFISVVLISLYVLRRLAARERAALLPPGTIQVLPSLRQTLADLGFRTSQPVADVSSAVQTYAMVVPAFIIAAGLSAILFKRVHTPVNPVQIESMLASRPFDQLLMLIETAICAPFVEELMFRGVLQPALRAKWGAATGMVSTAAIFALLHPNLPSGFLPLWTLGMAFGIVFQRRQSLLPGMLMHSFHNAYVTVTMFLIFGK